MKKSINLIILLCLGITGSITFYSCQSTVLKPTPKPVHVYPFDGYWTGAFLLNQHGNDLDSAYESILFRSNGTLRVYDFITQTGVTDTTKATAVADGSFTVLSPTTITMTFTFDVSGDIETFSGTGTFNTAITTLHFPYTASTPTAAHFAILDGVADFKHTKN